MPFACSICEQESTRICVFCTKDACAIHICERCGCCSDCCQCDVPLLEPEQVSEPAQPGHEAEAPAALSGPSPDSLEPAASADPPLEPSAPAEAQPVTPVEPGAEPFETPEA